MNAAALRDDSRRGLLRGAGIAFGCVLLTLVFALAQFPWDRLTPWLVGQIERATGARMEIAHLGASWSTRGPAAELQGLVLHFPGEEPLAIERLRVRPAFSASWLAGEPALAIELALAGGQVWGTVWPTGESGFDGSFEDIDTVELPPAFTPADLPLDGLLSGDADLRRRDGHWVGELSIYGEDGSLALPGLPIALPFDEFAANLSLGEDGNLSIEDGRFEGPLASFDATGTVALDAAGRPGALDLVVRVRDIDPSLQGIAESQGFLLNTSGGAEIVIRGTVDVPQIELR